MIFPKTRPCWLIWEHFIKPQGNVRYLRAVDTTEEMKDVHLIGLNQEQNHGRFETEEALLNHAMGHSMLMVAGDVRRLPIGD
jgi:hypothetical protein